MFPTVVSSEIERALLDYLRATFRLRDKNFEEELFRFLRDGETGIFRGPYLDIRLPFRKASESWERTSPLDFGPSFVP
jgi:DEAD/DEAH box helicase domain-containing protein